MSCFDSVYIRCPNCNENVRFTTKAGRCWMDEYKQHAVPLLLAAAIDGDVEECKNCHTKVVATFVSKITTVAMHGVDEKQYEEEEE